MLYAIAMGQIIIMMYMMNRKIIPGRKRGFDGVLYNL